MVKGRTGEKRRDQKTSSLVTKSNLNGLLFYFKEVADMPSGKNATLTPKQKNFAEEYVKTGNATQSYLAVYKCKPKTAEANSCDLLRNTKVAQYIQELNDALDKATIADMTEIKEYWTNILRRDPFGIAGGLKASEYIAKTNAAFIEKIDHSGKIELPSITITK